MNTLLAFLIVYWISILIPAAIGGLHFKRLELEMKLLFALITVALTVEVATYPLAVYGHNTNWLHNLYLIIELLMIGFIYSRWQDNRSLGNWILGVFCAVVFFHIVSIIFVLDINEMNSFMMTLSCILYAVISALTLYFLQMKDTGSIYRNHIFWVSSGLLIYAAGCLSYFAFAKIMVSDMVWNFHIIVNILAYCLFSAGFLCHTRR
jgi:hypothetical protein